MTAEGQGDRWLDVKKSMGEKLLVFGRQVGSWFHHSPGRLLDSMAYYKFASKLIGPGKRVLDIGCGEGLGTWLLAVENGFAHGVELDTDAVACARRNFGHDPRIAFSNEDFLQMAAAQWDAIVCFDVIERVLPQNGEGFWGRIAGSLKHDGIAVVGTPNITSDQFASPMTRAGRVNLYSGERLDQELTQFFHHAFVFAANDEVVHTGFLPLAQYLIAVGCRKRNEM